MGSNVYEENDLKCQLNEEQGQGDHLEERPISLNRVIKEKVAKMLKEICSICTKV